MRKVGRLFVRFRLGIVFKSETFWFSFTADLSSCYCSKSRTNNIKDGSALEFLLPSLFLFLEPCGINLTDTCCPDWVLGCRYHLSDLCLTDVVTFKTLESLYFVKSATNKVKISTQTHPDEPVSSCLHKVCNKVDCSSTTIDLCPVWKSLTNKWINSHYFSRRMLRMLFWRIIHVLNCFTVLCLFYFSCTLSCNAYSVQVLQLALYIGLYLYIWVNEGVILDKDLFPWRIF